MAIKTISTIILILALPAITTSTSPSCNILLTNDDGINSPALTALSKSLSQAGHNILTVAPSTERSGSSSSRNPITINTTPPTTYTLQRITSTKYSFDGTPVDTMQVALKTILPALNKPKPHLVISGPNLGPNLGFETILQSGTIGAALHASINDIPSLAISIGVIFQEFPNFPTTVKAIPSIAQTITKFINISAKRFGCTHMLPKKLALNVNIPVPLNNITGFEFADLGTVGIVEIVYKDVDGGIGSGSEKVDLVQAPVLPDVGSVNGDVKAFGEGKITLTLLSPDLRAGSVWRFPKLVRVIKDVLGRVV